MVEAHGISHTGHVRSANEDTLLLDRDLQLYVVADGMGGHKAGDVASQLAVETVRAFMERSRDGAECTWPFGVDRRLSLEANRLQTAVKLANRRVFKTADSRDEYTGMGTTIVAAFVQDQRIMLCGVGDSRVYRYASNTMTQLTEDDSWLATMRVTDPSVDEAALASHPMRHVLTNVLGAMEETDVDIMERVLGKDAVGGEQYLLCSDGLHGAIDDQTIGALLATAPDVREAAESLVQTVLEGPATDNVTALLIQYRP